MPQETTVIVEKNPTLSEAVNAAAQETLNEKPAGGEVKEGSQDTTGTANDKQENAADARKEDSAAGETAKIPTEVEIEATPEEINNALTFFRALSDPKQRQETLEYLAKTGGYDLTKRQERQQLLRDTKSILKEKLGDTYELISGDGLAEALDALVDAKVEKLTKPAIEEIERTRLAAQQEKANAEMDSFFKRHDIPTDKRDTVAEQMLSKMKFMPPTADADLKSYLDDIYTLASKSRSETKVIKETVKRIEQNAKDLRGSGDGGDDNRIRKGSKLPSLNEAISAAVRGEKFSDD